MKTQIDISFFFAAPTEEVFWYLGKIWVINPSNAKKLLQTFSYTLCLGQTLSPNSKRQVQSAGTIRVEGGQNWGKYLVEPGYFWYKNRCYLIQYQSILISPVPPTELTFAKHFIKAIRTTPQPFLWLNKIGESNIFDTAQNLTLNGYEEMFGDTLRKKQPHLLSIADYHAVTLLSGYAFQGTNVEFRGSDWLKLFIKFFMTPVMKLYYLIGYDGKKIGDLDMVCMMELFQLYLRKTFLFFALFFFSLFKRL